MNNFKIITYNVNGIRAALTKGWLDWLKDASPDVLCLQELKAQSDQLPQFELQELGYQLYSYPADKKGYSGVAIVTKHKPDKIETVKIEEEINEGRLIRADFGDLSIVSVYIPSGSSGEERQAFKMHWLDLFQKYVADLLTSRKKLIICGDYNICHQAIDIHNPVSNAKSSGFLPEERAWIGKFIDSGFIDTWRYFHPDIKEYSWWSFRFNARAKNLGWRIDYNMASKNLEQQLASARILSEAKHSDHCPVELIINI